MLGRAGQHSTDLAFRLLSVRNWDTDHGWCWFDSCSCASHVSISHRTVICTGDITKQVYSSSRFAALCSEEGKVSSDVSKGTK